MQLACSPTDQAKSQKKSPAHNARHVNQSSVGKLSDPASGVGSAAYLIKRDPFPAGSSPSALEVACVRALISAPCSDELLTQFGYLRWGRTVSLKSRLSSGIASRLHYMALVDAVQSFDFKALKSELLFVTVVTALGVGRADKPDLSVQAVRAATDKLLRKLKLEGLIAFEVDILTEAVLGEPYRRIHLHGHGLCTAGFKIDTLRKKVKKLNRMLRGKDALGYRVIDVEVVRAGTVPFLAKYLSEEVARAKQPVPRVPRSRSLSLEEVQIQPGSALALELFLARHQIQVRDAILGIGWGRHLRKAWSKSYSELSGQRRHAATELEPTIEQSCIEALQSFVRSMPADLAD